MSEYNLNVANDSMLEIHGAVDGLRRIKEVASDAQARAADSLVKPAKTLVKIVHDQRMAVSRKVDALKKQLIAKENEICSELNAEIERVSGLCGAYMNAKLAEQARAAAEAEARRAEAGRRAEDVLLAVAVRFRRTEVHVDMVRARHDAARTASAHPDRERVAAIGLEGERVGAPADVRRTVARHPDGGRIAMPALRRPGGPRRLGRRPADGTPAGSRGEVRVGNGDGRDGGEGRRHRGEERSESVHGTDASVSEVEGC